MRKPPSPVDSTKRCFKTSGVEQTRDRAGAVYQRHDREGADSPGKRQRIKSAKKNSIPHASRRNGLTMVETVVATLIVGGLCVVALNTVGAAVTSHVHVSDSARATLLAQELMAEIMEQEYVEPDGAIPSLGRESGEGNGDRLTWDDVDDYEGLANSPPEDRDGSIRTLDGSWKRSVDVQWVTPDDSSIPSGSETNIKRIAVTVERDGIPLVTLTALKSIGLPPPNPNPTVLLVVNNVSLLGANETARKALIESWGLSTALINAAAPLAEFQTAAAGAVAAYVTVEIAPTDLNTKLSEVSIGVVNEQSDLADEFGFSSTVAVDNSADVVVVDATHYITSPFVPATPTILYTITQQVFVLGAITAPGMQTLGGLQQGASVSPSFAVLESGALDYKSFPVPGRRVQLPWGAAGFDFSALTTDGQTMMKRAIEWAGGLDTP